MAIVLALGTCLAWGTSDYIAGRQGRTLAPLTIAFGSNCVGLVLLTTVLVLRPATVGPGGALLPAALGGLLTALGLVALYRALAIGPMTLIAPISGTGAAVPVLFGLALGEAVAPWQWIGIALALVGVPLAATPTRDVGDRPPAAMAGPAWSLLAAVALGGSLVAIDRASESDALWTATLVHASALVALGLGVALVGVEQHIPSVSVPPIFAVGILGATGHALFAWSASIGLVAVVAVLASLYPVTTVLLARALGGERVSRGQGVGVVLALTGVALISAG